MLNKVPAVVFVLSIVAVFTCANIAKAQFVEDGLISYWSFDNADMDGKTVIDLRGDNDGTIEGAPGSVEGHFGEALEFHGQPDRVVVADSESLAVSDKFTVEAWTKVIQYVTNAAVVTKGTTSGFFALEVAEPKGFKVRVNSGGNSQGIYLGLFDENRWYHLIMIVDGRGEQGLKLYVDGEVITPVQNSLAVGDIACTNPLYIGYEERNKMWFIGVIDEVRIYNRALSEAEIQRNFVSAMAVEYSSDKLSTIWAKIKEAQ